VVARVKYYATIDPERPVISVTDEDCEEVFRDILIHGTPRAVAADMKLAEFGFTRAGEWEQSPAGWQAECAPGSDPISFDEEIGAADYARIMRRVSGDESAPSVSAFNSSI
jgi:hypothetical protein